MRQEILETKQFFENNHIKLSDFWLESCINWFHEERGSASYTKTELHTKVYQQWLLLDLRDVDVAVLPANINNEKKIVLNISFSLQLMSVVDISKSKFGQLQKIKNLNALTRDLDEEKETEPGSKRALQLMLTDGIQEIKALEYKPIPVLNINLTPGMKIKINGPITIRRGQMMLEQQNVQLLGGEVEELLIPNSAENILARYLNLPENLNPSIVHELPIVNESINKNYTNNNSRKQNTKHNLISTYTSNKNNASNNKLVSTNLDISKEEEMRIAAEVEMLFETEKDSFVVDTKRQKYSTDSNMITEEELLEMGEDIFTNNIQNRQLEEDAEIEALLETERELLIEANNRVHNVTPNIFNDRNKAAKSNNVDDNSEDAFNDSLEEENELFKSLEMDKHLEKIETLFHVKQEMTIKEVLDNVKIKKYGKYKIHAKFKSVIQKMTVKDDKWIAQIYVTDNENELAVYMHSDLVAEISGLTPQEAMNLKQNIENKSSSALQKIMKKRIQ